MERNEMITQILSRVMEKLAQAGETVTGAEALQSIVQSIVTDTQEQLPGLLVLTQEHGEVCHELLENPKIKEKYRTSCALLAENQVDLEGIETVVLFNLTTEAMCKIASGITDTPYTRLAAQAFLMGKKLYVPREEVELYRYPTGGLGSYQCMMQAKLTKLVSFGLKICPMAELEDALLGKEAEETPEQSAEEAALDLDHVLQNDMTVGSVLEQEHREENKGAEKRMDVKTASDENAIITAGMVITGDVSSEGSMDLVGTINGNIDILGKLNITGYINGNSKAAEIFAEGAKINGEIMSEGSVKIGASTVVIGNITATSAAIAGAVKGDIDVQGPVILDSSAIVMGNIKSKSVQINNGAVIEGMCSQCYADVSPTSFFDDYKPEKKKTK